MSGLTPHHARSLLASCRQIDHQLAQIEALLEPPEALMPRTLNDLTPEEKERVREHVRGLREGLRLLLEDLGIPTPRPETTARWAVRAAVLGVRDSLTDMASSRLRGYGDLSDETAARLDAALAALDQGALALLAALGGKPTAK